MPSPSEYTAAVVHALQSGCATVKLTDFGFSQQLLPGQSHAAGARVGTPFYVAPELLQERALFPATDIFAFGVIMWELMAGHPVFIPSYAPHPHSSRPRERYIPPPHPDRGEANAVLYTTRSADRHNALNSSRVIHTHPRAVSPQVEHTWTDYPNPTPTGH